MTVPTDPSPIIAGLVPDAQTAIRLGTAALLGILLGAGRELRGKPAGLRTHGLMALSAAALCLAADAVAAEQGGNADRLRIFQALAQALGFLAAGAILGSGRSPRGLTTAVGLWIAGTVGIACGFGLFALAVTTTVASVVLLELLPFVEHGMRRAGARDDADPPA